MLVVSKSEAKGRKVHVLGTATPLISVSYTRAHLWVGELDLLLLTREVIAQSVLVVCPRASHHPSDKTPPRVCIAANINRDMGGRRVLAGHRS